MNCCTVEDPSTGQRPLIELERPLSKPSSPGSADCKTTKCEHPPPPEHSDAVANRANLHFIQLCLEKLNYSDAENEHHNKEDGKVAPGRGSGFDEFRVHAA
jgi:hypothetical protein